MSLRQPGSRCPPAEVFDMLADLRNDTRWNSRVSRVELLFPLLAPVIRRDVPKQYASFKALCEQ